MTNLNEFEWEMLSSLWSLGPKIWTTAREAAWLWLGVLVERPGMVWQARVSTDVGTRLRELS